MNWPAVVTPLLAPNFIITVLVIACATALLALRLIDSDRVQIKSARGELP